MGATRRQDRFRLGTGAFTVALGLLLALAAVMPSQASAVRGVYVSAASGESVSAFSISGSGQLAPIGTPYDTGALVEGIALTPDGRHLYAALFGSDTVRGYRVEQNGALTALGNTGAGEKPLGLAVSPDGRLLAVTNLISDDISIYRIGPNGGLAEHPLSPFSSGGDGPSGVTFSPDGSHLYVAFLEGAPDLAAFAVAGDDSLGALAGSPYELGISSASGVALTPDGRFLYVGHQGVANVAGLSIAANGIPTPLAGSPFALSNNSLGVAVAPGGGFLYLKGGSGVLGTSIGANGVPIEFAGSPFSDGGSGTGWLAITPAGDRLYASHQGSANVSGFNVTAAGPLISITNSPFAAGATPDFQALAITPDQGPVASLSPPTAARAERRAGIAAGSKTVAFDASGSTDPDGTVARYDWDFGDGSGDPNGGATPSHTYATDGTYTVQVTVTDNEGCSDEYVSGGPTAYCNGTAAATTTQQVVIDTAVSGAKLKGKRKQRARGKRTVIKLKASAGEAVTAVAKGKIKVGKRKYKLKKARKSLKAGKTKNLKLKLKRKKDGRRLARALKRGKRAKAKTTVKFTDGFGNKETLKRTVKLR